jgi:hypothetical protein
MTVVFIDHQPSNHIGSAGHIHATSYTDTIPSHIELPRYAIALICLTGTSIGPALIAVGTFRRGSRVTRWSRRYEISGVTPLGESVPLSRIIDRLPGQIKPHVDKARSEKAVLAPGSSRSMIQVLERLVEGSAELIAKASGFPSSLTEVSHARSVLLAEEKDTFGLIADLSGLGREHDSLGRQLIVSAEPADPDRTYMETVLHGYNDEDALITADMSRFGGVLGDKAQRNARGFVIRLPEETITVLNTNKRALEHTAGCDLIYFNADRHCGLLVQYKRMKKEGGRWVYRGDVQLTKELELMRSNRLKAGTPRVAEYRLNSEPHYLKVVRPTDYDGQSAELMKGLYLPLSLVDLMCASPTNSTKAGNLRIGWDDDQSYPTQRHLNNTMFTQLYRDGWIGSYGSQSDLIRGWIEPLFEADELVTVAIQEKTKAYLAN